MRRSILLMLLGCFAGAVLWVAASPGFPATYRAVHGFFAESLGLGGATADQATNFVRKAFHVPAYALLAMLTWGVLPKGRWRGWVVLGIVLVIAVTDEVLQSFQPQRNGRGIDVLLDLAGAGLGVLLARWVTRRRLTAGETGAAD